MYLKYTRIYIQSILEYIFKVYRNIYLKYTGIYI